MKTPLLLCSSMAAFMVMANSAMAQSDHPSAAGNAAGGANEMAPPARSAVPPQGDAGSSGAAKDNRSSAGPEMRSPNKSEARDTGPSKKAGDTAKSEPAKDAKTDRKNSADTGASDGTQGREMSEPQSRDRANKGDDKSHDASKGAGSSNGASEGTQGNAGAPSGSVTQLSGEERNKAQSAFRSHKSDATVKDIHISLNVGVSVPRNVTLYAVPEEVVIIVPAYRRYKYFIFEDKVVIVDPVTYAIIDVLVLA